MIAESPSLLQQKVSTDALGDFLHREVDKIARRLYYNQISDYARNDRDLEVTIIVTPETLRTLGHGR